MVELDGVTVTLERGHDWELVDNLCRVYDQAVELATRPHYTRDTDASLERRLATLAKHDEYIRYLLGRADGDNMVRFFQKENDATSQLDGIELAYDAVLSQIETIRTARMQAV